MDLVTFCSGLHITPPSSVVGEHIHVFLGPELCGRHRWSWCEAAIGCLRGATSLTDEEGETDLPRLTRVGLVDRAYSGSDPAATAAEVEEEMEEEQKRPVGERDRWKWLPRL